jgi:hypothetical protein
VDISAAAAGEVPGLAAHGLRLCPAPNPSAGRVAIAWRKGESGAARLEIVALDGRCVLARTVRLERGNAVWDGSLAGRPAPSGCYWVLVSRDGELLGRAALLRIE